jgi:arabinogalactan oligomer/maltooligosaccharide transport system substrate-binding protein
MNTKIRVLGVLAGLSIALAACSGPAGSSAPSAGGATASPAASGAASEAPSESAAALSGKLVIWHAYGSSGGNAEFTAFSKIVDNLKAANAGLDVELLEVPFGDMFKKFETEVAAGGGPDMLIAPNDSLGAQVRANFLADLTGKADDVTSQSTEISVAGSTIDGKLYEIPESVKAVAMYYDSAKVTAAPKTTDELLAFQKGGGKVGILSGPYFGWGFYNAFGGDIFDASGKCAAGANSGVADALKFIKEMKAAGALVNADYNVVNDAFKNGDVDIIFNGNWVLGDYKTARPSLAVAPVPAGPGGDAATMVGVDGWYINAAGQNIDTAIAAAKFMVSPESQQIYVDTAGHAPANTSVTSTDPLVTAFVDAINKGEARPQSKEMDNYWTPFDNAWKEVLDKGTDPAAAVTAACGTMDQANGK